MSEPSSQLYALLGVAPDADVARLRYAYEQAVADATRRGNRSRAIALSRAYDLLPPPVRRLMYSRTTSRGLSAPALEASRRPRRRRSPPPLSAFRVSDRTIRLLIWLLGVPIAVFAGVAIAVHRHDTAQRVAPPAAPAPVETRVVPAVTVPPAQIVDRHRRLIPADAPIDADGWVDVVCESRPGGPGYEVRFRRGAIAYCTNGATPYIVG